MNFLIVNRAFNDIDHITPIAYKLLQNNHSVNILIANEYLNYENDYRLEFLKRNGANVSSAIDYSQFKFFKIFFKILKSIYYSKNYSYIKKKISFAILERLSKKIELSDKYFIRNRFNIVIFDWTNPLGDNKTIKKIYSWSKKIKY